jgi:hypothetical protein
MMLRARRSLLAVAAFVLALGVTLRTTPSRGLDFACPRPAYASGTCSLTALACANDTSPGCEVICQGEGAPTCDQGTCSLGGNVATPNHCYCK